MPLELIDVSFAYPDSRRRPIDSRAVLDVSLRIEEGEFVGLMGKTGCGKSTLLQLMGGLISPSSGSVLFDGRDINASGIEGKSVGTTFRRLFGASGESALCELRRSVGLVFQYPETQLFGTTVARDVSYGPRNLFPDESSSETEARVLKALALVGLPSEAFAPHSPHLFSGGEKRRIAIAGVLASEPRILLLDEPVAGLDPESRKAFLALLVELHHAGTTIVMVSHDADSVAECCSRLIIMDEGRIVADGSVRDVFLSGRSDSAGPVSGSTRGAGSPHPSDRLHGTPDSTRGTGNPHPSDRPHGTLDSTRVSPGLVSSFTVPAAQRCANTLADRGLPVSRSAIRYDELCAEVLSFAKTCGTIHAKSSRRYSVSPDNLDPRHGGEPSQVAARLTPAEARHAGEALHAGEPSQVDCRLTPAEPRHASEAPQVAARLTPGETRHAGEALHPGEPSQVAARLTPAEPQHAGEAQLLNGRLTPAEPRHASEAPQVAVWLTPGETRHAGEAPIERVNPFVKLVLFICLAAAVLSANSVYSIAVLAAFALIMFAVSGSAGKECVARLSGLGWFFAFVFAMNFLFFSPETAFVQWWVFSPSAAGAVQGARIGFRIALVTAFAAVLTSSTTPVQLTGAIETLLFPLALFRVPVGEVAMILGIAFRFIPVLQDEADLVRKAQTARGARWQNARGANCQTARGARWKHPTGSRNQKARGARWQNARGANCQTARGARWLPSRGARWQTARGAHRKPPTGSRNQKARGARWKHRAGSGVAGLLPLVVPVCIAAFIRADELALAMEARGYQAGIYKQPGRKKLGNKTGRLVFIDAAAVFLTTLACMPILLDAL